MSERLRVGILGATGSWHSRRLQTALADRGHEVLAIPATRLQSEIDDDGNLRVRGPDGVVLDALDLLLVRGLPRGSLERTVYYVQRTIAAAGRRDLRVLVVGTEIAGAMERVTDSWRANIARGARAHAAALSEAESSVALAAASALGADVAGVDLLVAP